jgi:putative ABC transport system permease protein
MALRDVRFALRILKNNPGFASVSILALALGTGANTAIFTAVDAILIQPLPFAEPDRLTAVWEDVSHIGFPRNTPAPANYVDWKAQNTTFSGMAASRFRTFTIRGEGAPELTRGRAITHDLFDVLGTKPAIGRTFSAEEDRQNARVAVISHSLWVRRFGAEPSAVGHVINLNGDSFEIIGVMPRGFFYPERGIDLWTPINLDAIRTQRGNHFLQVIGRLKPGTTVEQARADMQTIAQRLQMQYPNSNFKVGSVVESLLVDLTGTTRVALYALLGAAGFVLLIACANLANLLLARASGRSREMAVRLAIGADQRSLLTQLLTESLILSMLGGLAGTLVAAIAVKALEKMLPAGIAPQLSLDPRAFAFAFAVAALSGLLFGLIPALQSAKLDLHSALKQTGRTGAGRAQGIFRDTLVAAEFALAFILLAGAGLLIQTIVHLQSVNLGFDPDHILTARVAMLRTKYPNDDKIRAFYKEATEKLQNVPGVKAAAFTSNLPYQTTGNTNGFEIEGRPPERDADALYREISPNYLAMMGAKLIDGRLYADSDIATSEPVIIINETFQKLYWPDGKAVGARIRYGSGGNLPWMRVIGVVRDLRERGAGIAMKPATYPNINQAPNPSSNIVAIRTSGDPKAMASSLRAVFQAIDPDTAVTQIVTMDDILDANTATRRYPMQIMSVFAGLALLLAAIGVYGVLSYSVAQRTREIGLRMALGADQSSVTRMVVGRGLMLGGIGLGVGLIGSLFVMRLIESVLSGVSPRDPVILGVTAAILAIVSAVASYVPAWRASRVDPLTALRED